MRIETFTTRQGEQRYRVINGMCVYDCGGVGYKTYESAQQGFYCEISKLRKAQLSAKWRAYKKLTRVNVLLTILRERSYHTS